jgi:peptide/nickel transport system substrate-binding protein
VVAVVDVGPPLFYGHQLKYPYSDRNISWAIYESLLSFDGLTHGPMIAESWSLDSTGVTYKIRKGVKFHGLDFEATADDVVWTWTDSIKEKTLHTMAGNVTRDFSKIEALDASTVRMTFKEKPTIRWAISAQSVGNAFGVQSKKLFEQKGVDYMNLNEHGTGPYRVASMVADDKAQLEAVPNHWREAGYVQTISVLEVPEQATRIAMLKTGEADIANVGVPFFADLKGAAGVRIMFGKIGGDTGSSVFPAGQYYAKAEQPWIKGKQWVGDPADAKSMENAANVRKALSYAIDRKAIIEKILNGTGCAQYMYRVNSCNPNWNKKWETPYDPAMAKKLLADAGYPNGFAFTYFIPTGLNATIEEVGEALVPMWEAAGLKPTIQKTAYSARRPEMLARSIADIWIFTHGDSSTPADAVQQIGELGGEGTWNMGIARPESLQHRDKVLFETDFQKAWGLIGEWIDWQVKEQPVVQAVTWRDGWGVGKKVASWDAPIHGPLFPTKIVPAD